MKLSLTIVRRYTSLLLALACLGAAANVSSAASPYTKSLRANITPSKVVRFSKPTGSYGSNEYTNPCFIAPEAYLVPTNWNQNELSPDDFWFWFE